MGSELVLAAICALIFFGAGRFESSAEAHDYSFPWALMSALLSALMLVVFKAPWGVLLFCQVGLFIGIGVFRAIRERV